MRDLAKRTWSRSIGAGFFIVLGLAFPVVAPAITVEQLLMDLNDDAKLQADLNVKDNRFTRLREAGELTTIDSSFTIVGGGALVLCERGHFQAQGVCDAPEGISDVVGFVAGQAQLTVFSDADDGTGLAGLGLDLSNETLINKFGPTLRFIQEGFLLDERGTDAPLGPLVDLGSNSDVTIYVFRAGKGFHAFVVHSDTREVAEPSTLLLLASGLAAVAGVTGRRRRG
jgi:hypothetical protein